MSDTAPPSIVVFDLGGVLFDWDPRHLYRDLFDDEQQMERFLAEVVSPAWNATLDAGRPFADAVADAQQQHPEHTDLIAAYRERWPSMLRGPIDGTVAILAELHSRGVPLYALTNWSAEMFPHARAYPFMGLFRAHVVSGEIGMVKPDPAIYAHLLGVVGEPAQSCVFIDDARANVDAARAAGLHGIVFTTPDNLRRDLGRLGLPVSPAAAQSPAAQSPAEASTSRTTAKATPDG